MGCGGFENSYFDGTIYFSSMLTQCDPYAWQRDCQQTHARPLLRVALSTWTLLYSLLHLVFIYHLAFPKYIKGCSKRMYGFDFAVLHVQFSLLTLSILCCPSCCEPLVNVTLWAGARYLTQEPELCAFVFRGCQFNGKCESIENNRADGALGIHGCLLHLRLQDLKQITEFLYWT
jgi:hypothetical protein